MNSVTASRWSRFLVATCLFLAFEALLIVVFGDYYFEGVSTQLGVWAMIGVASAGYFFYGLFSGSWASAFFIVVPLLLAMTINSPVPEAATYEPPILAALWFLCSAFFLPAWGLGAILWSLIPADAPPRD